MRRRVVEIERQWAVAEARITGHISTIDPARRTRVLPVGDGTAVLAGPGLFVNRLLAAGLSGPLDPADLAALERASADLGVPAAVDVGDDTHASVASLLRERGYVPTDSTEVLVHDLSGIGEADPSVAVDVVGRDQLTVWQAVTAAGWGHETPERRAVSDVYAAAAFEVDRPGLLLATATESEAPLAAAMLRIADGIATLGGMSTRPEARGRGLQAALINHRLRLAVSAGCRYAATVAAPDGGSVRNLRRAGFVTSHRRVVWERV